MDVEREYLRKCGRAVLARSNPPPALQHAVGLRLERDSKRARIRDAGLPDAGAQRQEPLGLARDIRELLPKIELGK